MFQRPHHQRIAHILAALDAEVLRAHACWFGGGTCIALRWGEYRESVDIDFLVSELSAYRALRTLLTGAGDLTPLTRAGAPALVLAREWRADQYGLRTQVHMDGHAVKFEIVREARVSLDTPKASEQVCGVSTLSTLDLATSKLLANADRYADDGVFSRDVIDLAMMALPLPSLRAAVAKASGAYGDAITRDLARAIDRLQERQGWLTRCMQALAITMPKALLWQRIRVLRRVLPNKT